MVVRTLMQGGNIVPNCDICTRECTERDNVIGECDHLSTSDKAVAPVITLHIIDLHDGEMRIRHFRARRLRREWRIFGSDIDRIRYVNHVSTNLTRVVGQDLALIAGHFASLVNDQAQELRAKAKQLYHIARAAEEIYLINKKR